MTTTCELHMPADYVQMDDDEMEYVEGGLAAYKTEYVTMTALQCARVAALAAGGAWLFDAIGSVCPKAKPIAKMASRLCALTTATFTIASAYNGIRFTSYLYLRYSGGGYSYQMYKAKWGYV